MGELKASNSLAQAQLVLDLVLKDARIRRLNRDHLVEAYQNGREQGFAIQTWNYETHGLIAVSWAEHRNSDDIVVYVGQGENQGLSDDAWKNSKGFRYDDHYGAAQYIIETLIDLDATKFEKVEEF